MNIEFYEKLEEEFDVVYPNNENATYSSLLNYFDENKIARQRWYRYKEGYSTELVKKLLKDYNKNPNGIILDPFLGSGTTIIAANEMNLKGVGFEVNPFSFFLSKCKIDNYSQEEIKSFKIAYKSILNADFDEFTVENYTLPKLSISDKSFEIQVEKYLFFVKNKIDKTKNIKIKNLLKLGWLSSLEHVSRYRKAGNGLKIRNNKKNIISNYIQVKLLLEEIYSIILVDISKNEITYNAEIYNDSALNMHNYIEKKSLSGAIFSPPYANSFDYTEIYKIELWFGEFIKEYSDLKMLRQESLRSHLNGLSVKTDITKLNLVTINELDELIEKLQNRKLWDKKIPLMLKLYFSQMFNIINNLHDLLDEKGFCSIIVGNSSYGGVIFPTDLLLAKYAKMIGYTVDKIEVDRYIITSSQQYKNTLQYKKFLRESVVCLKKN